MNYIKLTCDALQGIAYLDDKQIHKLTLVKRYGESKTEITIKEAADETDV